jgi:hypothetical protein
MSPRDRRTTPRLEVLSQIHGRLVPFGVPLTIREISAGGFSLESSVAFPVGGRYWFRFATAAGPQVVVEGAVTHTRQVSAPGTPPRHISGFAFTHEQVHDRLADIEILLEALTDAPEFEEAAP